MQERTNKLKKNQTTVVKQSKFAQRQLKTTKIKNFSINENIHLSTSKKSKVKLPKLQIGEQHQFAALNSDRPKKLPDSPLPNNTDNNENEESKNKNEGTSNWLHMTAMANSQSGKSNIKVFVRFRPWNEIETDLLNNNVGSLCVEYWNEDNKSFKSPHLHTSVKTINKTTNTLSSPYTYDTVFDIKSHQKEIYNIIGTDIKNDILSGYNGTIFAYGQSGSGKTFTMYGSDIYDEENCGVIPRWINDLFNHVDKCDDSITFQFKMSFLQIYKEIICDWLTGEINLKIKESPAKGIYVDKLTEVYVDSFENFMGYIDIGQENRYVSETKLNSTSSRSHSIWIFEVTQNNTVDNFSKKGTLNLVDLAGSEKISKTGAVGETLEEAKKINLSLSALGNVIHSLTSSNTEHIPYRDSKLTRILQESLGGNYKTSLIVTCSPHSYHLEETVSSLKFAQRVKHIKNKVKVNIKWSYEELQKIIANLKKALELSNGENASLREWLEKNSIDCSDIVPVALKWERNNNVNKTSILPSKTKDLIEKNDPSNNNSDGEDNEIAQNKTSIKNKDNPNKRVRFNWVKSKTDKLLTDLDNLPCKEHWEIIQRWNQKIEMLQNDIKEKEEIISTLETANWNKQREILNKPVITSIFNNSGDDSDNSTDSKPRKNKTNNDNDNNNNNKNINNNNNNNNNEVANIWTALENKYNSIHNTIIEINPSKHETPNNVDFTFDSFNGEMRKWINKITKMYEATVNTEFQGYASNWPTNLISNISNWLKHSLWFQTETKFDANLNTVHKDNISSIFDSIFWLNTNLEGNADMIKKKLIKFSSLFLFGFTQLTFNNQITNCFNNLWLTQNNQLQKSNWLWINIVDDWLKSNIDISRNLNNASINKFHNSIIGEAGLDWFKREAMPKRTLNGLEQCGYQRSRGKILTILNKKGRDMMNQLKARSKNNLMNWNPVRRSSLIQLVNINEALKETNENQENEENSRDSSKNNINNINTNNNNNNNNDIKNEEINALMPIPEFSKFENKQEKKNSKLSMLKEYLIKSLRLTEEHKNDVARMMEGISTLIKGIEQNLLLKLKERGVLQSDDLETYAECKGLWEWNVPLSVSDNDSNSNNNNNAEQIPSVSNNEDTKTPLKNEGIQKVKKEQIHSTHHTARMSNCNNLEINIKTPNSIVDYSTITHQNNWNGMGKMAHSVRNINKHKLDLFSDTFGNSLLNTMMNSMHDNPIKSKWHIQNIINNYWSSGTVTRKFDGISVKMENSKVSCVYEGGLNANNSIMGIPLSSPWCNNEGDNDEVTNEEL